MGSLADSGVASIGVSRASGFEHVLRSPALFIDSLPIGIYSCDKNGVLTQYNQRAAELWGRSPEIHDPAIRFCGSLKSYRPDSKPLALEDSR